MRWGLTASTLTLLGLAAFAQPRWTKVAVSGPPPRDDHAMAYDQARGVTVLFGGLGATLYGDTWEWNGSSWKQLNPANKPLPREAHRMAYDVARQKVVMFGGWDGGNYYGDTWEWDGADWANRTPGVPSPTPRDNSAMAWEPARQKVVLFGGADSPGLGRPDDTWEWDGTAWFQVVVAPRPLGRYRSGLFAPAPGQLMVFGGLTSSLVPFGDTWLSPSRDAGWVSGPGSGPPARHSYAAATDTLRRQVVLFGGHAAASPLGDTWEFNGTWQVVDAGPGPSARGQAAMVYDSARQVMVLFGGDPVFADVGGTLGDTWEYGDPAAATDGGGTDGGLSLADGGDGGGTPAALEPRVYQVGCGCAEATPLSTLLVALVTVLLGRRRATASKR